MASMILGQKEGVLPTSYEGQITDQLARPRGLGGACVFHREMFQRCQWR